MWGCKFFYFSGLGVVGMEYFVYLVDVGMQVFLCFQDDEEVGCKFFRTRRRSEWNVLWMWGLRRRGRRRRRRGTK
jgi:hypothetical protein